MFQDTYVRFLSRTQWGIRLNKYLFHLAARGLGILNFRNRAISGEQFIFDAIARWRQDNDFVYVDVGANTGYYSHIPQLLEQNPQAKVYAIEPHPKNLALLTKHAKELGYTVLPYAIGDTPGKVSLYDVEDGEDGRPHASMYKDAIQDKGKKYAVEVEVVTLDSLMREQQVSHIHVMNLDVEGHEFPVLAGAADLIKKGKIDIIFMEFNSMNIVSKHSFRDFYELLSGRYWILRLLPQGLLQLPPDSPLFTEIYAFQNLVCVRKDSSFADFVKETALTL